MADKVILLIDDVTTTGEYDGVLLSVKIRGAKTILPLALLETANYEE